MASLLNKILGYTGLFSIFFSGFNPRVSEALDLTFKWDPPSEQVDLYALEITDRTSNIKQEVTVPGSLTETTINFQEGLYFIQVNSVVAGERSSCLGVDCSNKLSIKVRENPLIVEYLPLPLNEGWEIGESNVTEINNRIKADPPTDAGLIGIPINALDLKWIPSVVIELSNEWDPRQFNMTVTDNQSKKAFFYGTGTNFNQGENLLIARLDEPGSGSDLGFDFYNIKSIEFNAPFSINLEGLVITRSSEEITGRLNKGLNAYNVNNTSNFNSSNGFDISNKIEALGSRLTSSLPVEAYATGLGISTQGYTHLIFRGLLSEFQYNSLLSGDNPAIKIYLEDDAYEIFSSQLKPGTNEVILPIHQNVPSSVDSVDLEIYPKTRLSTRSPTSIVEHIYLGLRP